MQTGPASTHGFKQAQERIKRSSLYQGSQQLGSHVSQQLGSHVSQNLPSLAADRFSSMVSQRGDSVLGEWRDQAASGLSRITEDGAKTKAVYMNVGGTELFNPHKQAEPQQALPPGLSPILSHDGGAQNINLQLNVNATVNFNLSKCAAPEETVYYSQQAGPPEEGKAPAPGLHKEGRAGAPGKEKQPTAKRTPVRGAEPNGAGHHARKAGHTGWTRKPHVPHSHSPTGAGRGGERDREGGKASPRKYNYKI